MVRDAGIYMAGQVVTTLFIWLLIGTSLALPVALWLIHWNLSDTQRSWESDTGLSAFFAPGTTPESLQRIVSQFEDDPVVDDLFVISGDAALREFVQSSGLPETFTNIDFEPLPASINITVAVTANEAQIDALIQRLHELDDVVDVVLNESWLVRFEALKEIVIRLAVAFAGVFVVSTFMVTAAAVRLAITARLDEVKILFLLGSSKRLIQGSFNCCGLIYGAGGGVIAAMLLAGGITLIADPLMSLSASYGIVAHLYGFNYLLVLALISTGALFGLLGASYITRRQVWQFTRHWEN